MKMVAQSSHAVYTNSTACGKQSAGQLLQSHPALVFQLFLNHSSTIQLQWWPVSLWGPVSSLPLVHRSQLGGVTKA